MTTITFITGANKGLGYETARRLTELGHTVILGARDPERGEAAAGRLGVRFVPIDVTDDASVAQAAADVEAHEGRVDRIINNAGIVGSHAKAEDLVGDDAALVFDTNVSSIVRVTHAFLPLLGRSDDPAVINVSSGMGSQTLTHDPDRVESTIAAPLYTASKAAVTMLTMQYARRCRTSGSTPPTPATPLPTSTGTAVPRLSPRAPTQSSPWSPNHPRQGPAGTSTASGLCPGEVGPPARDASGRSGYQPSCATSVSAPRRGRRSRADPRQNPVNNRGRLLDVQEVAGALDNLHPRPSREVTPGVLHEGQIDAAVTVPVQVQSRLRPGASQRLLFSRIRAIRGEVAEPWLIGPVIADRRREVALAAQALLDVPEIFARVVARAPPLRRGWRVGG